MFAAFVNLLPRLLDMVDKVVPDKVQAELTKQKIELELITAANEMNKMQAETNKVEAGHRSVWVAGWRPAIGWCCSLGVAWFFIIQPLLQWLGTAFGVPLMLLPVFPEDHLFELVFALLGMGTLRSVEKIAGVSK